VFACHNTVCGIEVVHARETVDNGPNGGIFDLHAVARCPRNKHAISGGFYLSGNLNQVAVHSNSPVFVEDEDGNIVDPLPVGWEAGSIRLNEDSINAPWTIEVWAVCASVE
jgi:hypothetical protein